MCVTPSHVLLQTEQEGNSDLTDGLVLELISLTGSESFGGGGGSLCTFGKQRFLQSSSASAKYIYV